MPFAFDAVLKDLARAHPRDWLAVLGLPVDRPIEVLNPDLSTISRFADVVLRIVGFGIVHLDFPAGADLAFSRRQLLYNALLHHLYNEPVHTVAVLLRPGAGHPGMHGRLRYALAPRGATSFRFEVVRVWLRPADDFLLGGLGLLPLAPLAKPPAGVPRQAGLRQVVERMAARVDAELAPPDAAHLMTAAFILSGLRLPKAQAVRLFDGVKHMHESSTYEYILDQGREQGLVISRKMLFRLGERTLGSPSTATIAAIDGIRDLERLDRMGDRVFEATSWADLLSSP